jgi:hypothetical protein
MKDKNKSQELTEERVREMIREEIDAWFELTRRLLHEEVAETEGLEGLERLLAPLR